MYRFLFLLFFFLPGLTSAQQPRSGDPFHDDPPSTVSPDSEKKELDEDQQALAEKIRDAYWEANDKKGVKRKAEPLLFEHHEKMTQQWIVKLNAEDFALLKDGATDSEAEERKKTLEKDYSRRSAEVLMRVSLARRLAKKVIQSHWEAQASGGINRTQFPVYAADFDNTVETWFLNRSLEDLKIFEKKKPSESERERGAKIGADLLKTIDEVKKRYESNWH
jgi:hypothetical protein